MALTRDRYKHTITAHKPETRVTRWDILQPWAAVVLGFLIFCFWLSASDTHGRMFF